jgi:hypothetical protein
MGVASAGLVLAALVVGGCSGLAASPTPAEGYWCWMAPALPGPHKLENGRRTGPREEPCSQDEVSIYAKPGPTP